MAVKHAFTSGVADGADDTVVQPSDWNADHTIEDNTITEAKLSIADNTTKDVSTSAHGFVPKAPNNALQFLNGVGAWAMAGGYPCNGRLTLETGVAISATDQADKETLYFTPFRGNHIALYDGSSAWGMYAFAELSLSLSGYTASKPYDIWVYNNSGTLTLASTVWTDATTRATALTTQDGILVKTGATNYRYVGTIYIDADGKTDDSIIKRFVWNYYNRIDRNLLKSSDGAHNYEKNTVRYWNGDTSQKVEFITGVMEDYMEISLSSLHKSINTNYFCYVACVLDGATGGNNNYVDPEYNDGYVGAIAMSGISDNRGTYSGNFSSKYLGYHFIAVLEVTAGGTGTYTAYNMVASWSG